MKTGPSFLIAYYFLFGLTWLGGCQQEKELRPLEEKALTVKPKTVTMKFTKYCPATDRKRSDFFLINLTTVIENKRINIDLDSDGIPNYRDNDTVLNIGINKEDSNEDGYGDLLVYYSGLGQDQQNHLLNCADPSRDSDYDGLNDCEEKVLGSDPNNFDSDGDGVIDYLEVRNGLEPSTSDGQDAILDSDVDGLTNIEEIKANTPLYETNDHSISGLAVKYDNGRRLDITTAECYDYIISNIPIADSSSGNLIRVYFIERNAINLTNKYMHVYDINVLPTVEDESVIEYDYSWLQSSDYFIGTGH